MDCTPMDCADRFCRHSAGMVCRVASVRARGGELCRNIVGQQHAVLDDGAHQHAGHGRHVLCYAGYRRSVAGSIRSRQEKAAQLDAAGMGRSWFGRIEQRLDGSGVAGCRVVHLYGRAARLLCAQAHALDFWFGSVPIDHCAVVLPGDESQSRIFPEIFHLRTLHALHHTRSR